MSEQFRVVWHDRGREPKNPPHPDYPDGVDVDLSGGRSINCVIELPYPAKRCGVYTVFCDKCRLMAAITTAGRSDDPRSVKLACKLN